MKFYLVGKNSDKARDLSVSGIHQLKFKNCKHKKKLAGELSQPGGINFQGLRNYI